MPVMFPHSDDETDGGVAHPRAIREAFGGVAASALTVDPEVPPLTGNADVSGGDGGSRPAGRHRR